MKKLLGVTLGIMTALGGFVDLGQIVFTTQAKGSKAPVLVVSGIGSKNPRQIPGVANFPTWGYATS